MKLEMKLRLIVLVAFSLFPAVCFGGNLTNPALSTQPGKVSVGVEFNRSNFKMKPDDDSWKKLDIDMDQVYLRGSYGLFEGNEVYLKLGTSYLDAAGTGGIFMNGDDFSDASGRFSGAVGVKQSFEMAPKVRFGGTLQYARFNGYEDMKNYVIATERIKVKNPRELTAAMAISYVGESSAPYIGAVATWRRAKVYDTMTMPPSSPASDSTTYKEDGLVSGLFGVEVFRGNLRGNVEVHFLKENSAGFSVSYLF
ncbi:MAG: hypothetical protein HY890_01740 [Deltaproteobacteria bacterium]|nr:hypothetical protein [Deltaproteobacteria bacterium]